MFPQVYEYVVEKRKNRYAKKGVEWAFMVTFANDVSDSWCIMTWENEPSDEKVEHMIGIAERCFAVFANNIKVPGFSNMQINIWSRREKQ